MSWEVWTMPQKTSFCNGTLLRSDLRHFWPAGFVYVLIWLMILPIQLLRAGYDAPHDDGLLAENLEALLHNVIVDASVGSLVLAVVCGVVIPMAVYAYLMTPRSVGMMHALPVKRTTQYFSHFLAGFGLLTAGNLLIFLLSVLAQLPFGMVDWAALGQWLLLTELLELFFLSLGALCAMATGWLLAIPVLYVAVNFAALLLCSVVQFLQRWFYFGFQYTTYPPFVQWLTPIIKLAEDVGFLDGEYIARNGIEVYWRSLSAQALPTSAIYAAAGLVLLALGWLLYRKRPSEAAGDAIAFPWLRILVRWAVAVRRSGAGTVPQQLRAGRLPQPCKAAALSGLHGTAVFCGCPDAAAKDVPRLPPELEGAGGAGGSHGGADPRHPCGRAGRAVPRAGRPAGGQCPGHGLPL